MRLQQQRNSLVLQPGWKECQLLEMLAQVAFQEPRGQSAVSSHYPLIFYLIVDSDGDRTQGLAPARQVFYH